MKFVYTLMKLYSLKLLLEILDDELLFLQLDTTVFLAGRRLGLWPAAAALFALNHWIICRQNCIPYKPSVHIHNHHWTDWAITIMFCIEGELYANFLRHVWWKSVKPLISFRGCKIRGDNGELRRQKLSFNFVKIKFILCLVLVWIGVMDATLNR